MGRIINYPEINSLSADDYLVVDNDTGGTKKIAALTVAGEIDPVPTEDSTNAVRSGGVWTTFDSFNDKFEALKDDAYGVYPTIRSSSSIVTFGDGASNVPLSSLMSYICPTMSGSGMPSRNNVRTISGFDDIKIFHSEKNLINSVTYQDSPEKVLLGVESIDELIFLKAGDYRISVLMKDETLTVIPYWKLGDVDTHSQSISLDKDSFISIYVYDEDGIASNDIASFQLEYGTTITEHEIYFGEVTNVMLPSERAPVYLGRVDIVSGKLLIDAIMYQRNSDSMNNDENKPGWSYTGLQTYDVKVGTFDTAVYWGDPSDNNLRYTHVNVGSVYSIEYENDDYSVILPFDSYGLTQSQWISLGIDIQILVKLNTPLEIDIDKDEPRSFFEKNTYYNNSGDTFVGYRMDIKAYIDEQIANALNNS